jgi:Spy/CpxP family protein refolding chaperone
MFEGLDLTEAQKGKIKAIFAKARAGRRDEKQAMLRLIGARELDKAALTEAIEAKLADHDQKVERKVAMAVAVRDVLTESQREAIAAKLAAPRDPAAAAARKARQQARMAKIAEKLKMTEAQKAKFDAVLDAYAAGSEARRERWASVKAAMAAFATAGDADALKAALLAARPEIPVAAIVDALASLDVRQRRMMLALHRSHRQTRAACSCPGTSQVAETEADPAKAEETAPSQVESGDEQEPGDTDDEDDTEG